MSGEKGTVSRIVSCFSFPRTGCPPLIAAIVWLPNVDPQVPFPWSDLTDARSWNLRGSALLGKKEVEAKDGAALEDISWECFVANARNIDPN
jgi:hypothetical protein